MLSRKDMLPLSGLAYDVDDDVRLSSPDIGVAIGKSDGDWKADVPPKGVPSIAFGNTEKSL